MAPTSKAPSQRNDELCARLELILDKAGSGVRLDDAVVAAALSWDGAVRLAETLWAEAAQDGRRVTMIVHSGPQAAERLSDYQSIKAVAG